MVMQKFINFFKKIHADITAVTIQSNKIVLNKVKDNKVLLEPSYRKKKKNFSANLIFLF